MSKIIAGGDIGITVFMSMDAEAPLGIAVFHKYGASVIIYEELIRESKIDLCPIMRQRHACALEILAKQLREVPK